MSQVIYKIISYACSHFSTPNCYVVDWVSISGRLQNCGGSSCLEKQGNKTMSETNSWDNFESPTKSLHAMEPSPLNWRDCPTQYLRSNILWSNDKHQQKSIIWGTFPFPLPSTLPVLSVHISLVYLLLFTLVECEIPLKNWMARVTSWQTAYKTPGDIQNSFLPARLSVFVSWSRHSYTPMVESQELL